MTGSRDNDPEFVAWARAVKVRDEFTCQICSARGVQLESHHKNGWNAYPNQRYDLDNGVSLCKCCHDRFHSIFGKGGNTEFQYKQFVKTAEIFRKLLSSEKPPDYFSVNSNSQKL